MRVLLEISEGAGVGKKIHLRDGESVQIGRTEWSDFSLPEDPQLSSRHFLVQCLGSGCSVEDLGSTNGTFVNGQKIDSVPLKHGDRIMAGETTFVVSFEGTSSVTGPIRAPQAMPTAQGTLPLERSETVVTGQAATDHADSPRKTLVEAAEQADLGDEAKALLASADTPAGFVQQLAEQQLFTDAVKFWAHRFSKREAVLWACLCVRKTADELAEADAAALEAGERWVRQPNEENRRGAETAARNTQFETATSWVALGAFWSGGSLSAPELPAVPPADPLTAQAVGAALMLAATSGPATEAVDRYRGFLDTGAAIEDQSITCDHL